MQQHAFKGQLLTLLFTLDSLLPWPFCPLQLYLIQVRFCNDSLILCLLVQLASYKIEHAKMPQHAKGWIKCKSRQGTPKLARPTNYWHTYLNKPSPNYLYSGHWLLDKKEHRGTWVGKAIISNRWCAWRIVSQNKRLSLALHVSLLLIPLMCEVGD